MFVEQLARRNHLPFQPRPSDRRNSQFIVQRIHTPISQTQHVIHRKTSTLTIKCPNRTTMGTVTTASTGLSLSSPMISIGPTFIRSRRNFCTSSLRKMVGPDTAFKTVSCSNNWPVLWPTSAYTFQLLRAMRKIKLSCIRSTLRGQGGLIWRMFFLMRFL